MNEMLIIFTIIITYLIGPNTCCRSGRYLFDGSNDCHFFSCHGTTGKRNHQKLSFEGRFIERIKRKFVMEWNEFLTISRKWRFELQKDLQVDELEMEFNVFFFFFSVFNFKFDWCIKISLKFLSQHRLNDQFISSPGF